jgi:hypothetical protein
MNLCINGLELWYHMYFRKYKIHCKFLFYLSGSSRRLFATFSTIRYGHYLSHGKFPRGHIAHTVLTVLTVHIAHTVLTVLTVHIVHTVHTVHTHLSTSIALTAVILSFTAVNPGTERSC